MNQYIICLDNVRKQAKKHTTQPTISKWLQPTTSSTTSRDLRTKTHLHGWESDNLMHDKY